jgi:D-lactate dehydrogenase (cytochrome)
MPQTEAAVAALLAGGVTVLPIGAQSSLTGGATPMGEVVLGTARMNRILEIGSDFVLVQPGATLLELDAALVSSGTDPKIRSLLGEVFDLLDVGFRAAR